MSHFSESEFGPLDLDAYKHQVLLQRSHHCARPVLFNGKREFIHTLTESESGGRIEMIVYLKGISGGIDSSLITVEKSV